MSLCLWTHSKQFTQDFIPHNVEIQGKVNESIVKIHYVFTSRLLRVFRPGESDKGEKKKKKHKALQALVSEGQDIIRTVQTLIEQVREYLSAVQLNLSLVFSLSLFLFFAPVVFHCYYFHFCCNRCLVLYVLLLLLLFYLFYILFLLMLYLSITFCNNISL